MWKVYVVKKRFILEVLSDLVEQVVDPERLFEIVTEVEPLELSDDEFKRIYINGVYDNLKGSLDDGWSDVEIPVFFIKDKLFVIHREYEGDEDYVIALKVD